MTRPVRNERQAATSSSPRDDHIGAFYARHAARVQRTVARQVHATQHTSEDACQTR
jgi:hypothetical protein